jgi:protein involved in polysaccharide export with SLBB domain
VKITYDGENRIDVLPINDKGEIHIDSVGMVKAAGASATDLATSIADACRTAGKPVAGKVSVDLLETRSAVAKDINLYTCKSGDELTVRYGYANPDLRTSKEVTVAANGVVTLPLLGELQARGQTPQQLADAIAESAAKRLEPGPATFTVSVRNAAGDLITASSPMPTTQATGVAQATTTLGSGARPVQEARVQLPEMIVETENTPAASVATAVPTTQPAALGAPLSLTPEPRVDVVIVVQSDTPAPTTQATQTLEALPPAATTTPAP